MQDRDTVIRPEAGGPPVLPNQLPTLVTSLKCLLGLKVKFNMAKMEPILFLITCFCPHVHYLTTILWLSKLVSPFFLKSHIQGTARSVVAISPVEHLLIPSHLFSLHHHCPFWSLATSMKAVIELVSLYSSSSLLPLPLPRTGCLLLQVLTWHVFALKTHMDPHYLQGNA